jgi:hypothetical protein
MAADEGYDEFVTDEYLTTPETIVGPVMAADDHTTTSGDDDTYQAAVIAATDALDASDYADLMPIEYEATVIGIIVRAAVDAARAPLLARIAELEADCENCGDLRAALSAAEAEVDRLRHQLALRAQLARSGILDDLLRTVREMQTALAEPPASDERVRAWPLVSSEYGGIHCAEPSCGCVNEATEIVSAVLDDEDDRTFTVDDVHRAVAEHIAHRATVRAEEGNTPQ